MKKINVLSLCDGMSGGQISLMLEGFQVENYFAAEIKDIGIKVTKDNFPDTIHIGDVNKISYSNGVLHTEIGDFKNDIDLVIFGSPCQTFSIAMKADLRVGLENKEKSGLFLECYRILKEVNPKYFFMENVARMNKDDKDFISNLMGVEPVRVNSSDYSPQLRDRLYWTNIDGFTNQKNSDLILNNILDYGYSDRNKARALLVSDSRPLTTPIKMFHRYYSTGFTTLIFKSEEHYKDCFNTYKQLFDGKTAKEIDSMLKINTYDLSVFEGLRYLNQNELERCQSVPEGYTKCLNRNDASDVLGDGWTINVIRQFF